MNTYIQRVAEKSIKLWINTNKILSILGARQVGKTTLIKTFFSGKKIKYLNLDIEIDKQFFLRAVPLDPKKAIYLLDSPDVLIIDEAQRLPEVGRVVKGWFDSGVRSKIILTGSSSLNLLDESAENLTGRNIKLYLPPLIFSEVVTSQSWYKPAFKGEKGGYFSEQVNSLLMENMVYGSYPEAVITTDPVTYLNNLVSDYLLKDILQFGLVKNPEIVRRLLSLLAYQTGSVVSVNELSNSLGVSRITVNRYLDLLERTFVIFRLYSFSTNPRKEIAKSQKIFFWDTGVRNSLIGEMNLNPLRADIGPLWENWVVSEFAKMNLLEGNINKLYFWRSRIGSEVDLIIKKPNGFLKAYEIKWAKKRCPTKTFKKRYKIDVDVINKTNFSKVLMGDGV